MDVRVNMPVQCRVSNVSPGQTGRIEQSRRNRWVLITALLIGAVAGFWLVLRHQHAIRQQALAVAASGEFVRDGQYHTIGPFAAAPQARVWGSWAGDDANRGTLTLGPFPTPRRLVLGVTGYPDNEGNGLFLERVSSGKRARIPVENVGEAWRWFEYEPPEGWLGKPVRLVAVDAAAGYGGWLGVTEPLRDLGSGPANRRVLLRLWATHALVMAMLALSVGRWLARQRRFPALQTGAAGSVALFLLIAAPWTAWQHVHEPHFTTMLAGVVGAGALGVLVLSQVTASAQPLRARLREVAAAVRTWWRDPTLTVWVVGAAALLLFLRKPDTLHTPQLYAEDGSVFLAFTDAVGIRALWEPYMGYLHLTPMLTAWSAAKLLDVAWWPEYYNGIAFVIWVGVVARTFSRRFPLPGKPWLALAFVVGPSTGEVLFNITNAQWIMAFAFIQHALLTPPTTRWQRVVDIVILGTAGLTGPFSIVFGPLVAWHWWRERNGYTLAALLVVAAGAAVQGWTILHHNAAFDFQSARFHLWPAIEVTARRLLVWPALGPAAAHALPHVVVGVIGVAIIGPLLLLMLRPHPQRELRVRIVAAFFLILAIGIHRIRPDVWAADNLDYGDRYFYIPRVLLAWMLVLQFQAASRAIAWTARGLFLAITLVHLPDYVLPAPRDYHWKQHCDPIRRGEPANIHILPEGWWIEYTGRPKR